MAGRTVEEFGHAMWDMARMRIRDLLAVPWPDTRADVPRSGPGPNADPATIGEAFTSEQATGMALRLHIRAPGYAISGTSAGGAVLEALEAAWDSGNWAEDLTDAEWNPGNQGNDREEELVDQLETYGNQRTDVTPVKAWPSEWIRWQRGQDDPNVDVSCQYAIDVNELGNRTDELLDDDRESFELNTDGIDDDPP